MTVAVTDVDMVAVALDRAFRQVIGTMFGLTIEGPFDARETSALTIAGLVGLAGHDFRGMLQVACSDAAARKLAAALLGGEEPVTDDPAILRDSLGELANMIGGSLKRQLDDSGSAIELSLPTVLEGQSQIHGVGATDGAWLGWRVEDSPMVTSLVYADNG
jgi:CheY-specific phosphatase CheX